MFRTLKVLLLAGGLIGIGGITGVLAETEVPLELMVWGDETVVTASRYLQSVQEAPSTISVITAEAIKKSGAFTIPDALRRVEGIEVMSITSSDQQVSIRGFNGPASGKVLVMINGRSVYYELYGFVLWDTLPVSLEEIKQIEIIKGPGSALYGANAYCGVINIITLTPKEAAGTRVALAGGDLGMLHTTVVHGGEVGKLSYKLSAGYDQGNQWRHTNEQEIQDARADLSMVYDFSSDRKLSVAGGWVRSYKGKFMSTKDIGAQERDVTSPYLDVKYELSDLMIRGWWTNGVANTILLNTQETFGYENNNCNLEVQHNFKLGESDRLVYGAEGRYYDLSRADLLDEVPVQLLGAVYLQNEYSIYKALRLTLGGRYDYNSEAGVEMTPRGTLVYLLNDKGSLRFSGGTAFKNPSLVDQYLRKDMVVPYTALNPTIPLSAGDFFLEVRGNPELKPEQVTSWELGYQGELISAIKADVSLFYNQYKDFIRMGVTQQTAYAPDALYPGSPALVVPRYYTKWNTGKGQSFGGETAFNFKFSDSFTGVLNMSYSEVTSLEDDPLTVEDEEGMKLRFSPTFKANAGLNAKLKNGIMTNVNVQYVGETDQPEFAGSPLSKVDAYMLVNLRISRLFLQDKLELALVVNNLLDRKHYEYPIAEPVTHILISDEIGRKIVLSANYQF